MIILNPNVNVVGTTTVIPCTYREVTFEEYLSADSKTAYANHREKCFLLLSLCKRNKRSYYYSFSIINNHNNIKLFSKDDFIIIDE